MTTPLGRSRQERDQPQNPDGAENPGEGNPPYPLYIVLFQSVGEGGKFSK